MIFQLNKRGKILSVTKENDNSSEDFAVLKGYNFVSLVAPNDSAKATQFINDITDKSRVITCSLGLSLEHHSAPKYECVGVPTGEDSICVVARKLETDNNAVEDRRSGDDRRGGIDRRTGEFTDDALNTQLRFAKEQVRILFGKMPVALLVVNKKCAIETVNPVAEKMFGHPREVWRDLHLDKLIDGRDHVAKDDLFARLSETPGKLLRYDGIRNDGERFPLEISAEFMDVSHTKLLLCAFDITERMRLEKLKKEFVEMVSHDLRTPLSNLVIFLEAISLGLHKKWTDEKLKGNAERNFEEVSRLIRLINKLLEIDKLESGFDKPEFARLMLSDAVESAVNAVNATATKKGVTFDRLVPDSMILADPDQLAQILINLLGNAVKFSPDNGKITIKGKEEPDAVEIRICDQGPGIPEELRDHIFERFGQVKTAKSKEGTGLGLAICKSLVEAHGGTLGVTSEIGVGSEFWFRLPIQSEV